MKFLKFKKKEVKPEKSRCRIVTVIDLDDKKTFHVQFLYKDVLKSLWITVGEFDRREDAVELQNEYLTNRTMRDQVLFSYVFSDRECY